MAPRTPAVALLALFFAPLAAQAERLSIYDLDSLVYLSTSVVEGEILRGDPSGDFPGINVQVSAVHKGKLAIGQKIVVAAALYRRDAAGDRKPLGKGDRLVLFLGRAKDGLPPAKEVVLLPVESGIRLVQPREALDVSPSGSAVVKIDEVVEFRPDEGRGPYVADQPASVRGKPLTLEQFRHQVSDSRDATTKLAKAFARNKGKADAPWLMKLLAERSRLARMEGRDEWRDHIAELVCERLAVLHDPLLLSRALPLAPRPGRYALQYGFGTPEGRDFLLARVMDPKEPMAARIEYARTLAAAGAVYRSTFTEITSNSYRIEGKEDAGNSGYITRIGRAARANARHEDLCLPLLRCIQWFAPWNPQGPETQTRADLRGALAELKRLYEATTSERIRFEVELATARGDRKAYDLLKSPCGLVPSFLEPADPEKYTKSKERGLLFEYSYDATLLSKGVEWKPSVVLLHQRSRKRYVLPSGKTFKGFSGGGGSGWVVLPKGLPAGRYRVFFEVAEGKKVVSAGHFFEADL